MAVNSILLSVAELLVQSEPSLKYRSGSRYDQICSMVIGQTTKFLPEFMFIRNFHKVFA